MAVKISAVDKGSAAARAGIKKGDILQKIGAEDINDVLDYRFFMTSRDIEVELLRNEIPYRVKIKKEEYDDLGLEFDSYLMDELHHCKNNCIFCFIDQNPKGLRDELYFKDDDDRLSFLFGNYITLTNLSDHDVDRILKMHISPINVSIHTTDPELRVKLMKNRFAGQALEKFFRLCEGGIKINTQLVLCPGYNDGDALKKTLLDLERYVPAVQSIACTPVGLTDYREGLTPLRPFTREEAAATIELIESFGERWLRQHGVRVVYPADEFFLLAKLPVPPAEYYGDFDNLENGVGLIRDTEQEFLNALNYLEPCKKKRRISVATGIAAEPFIKALCDEAMRRDNALTAEVYAIPNRFYGSRITVTGLVTGSDIEAELKGRDLGDFLIIPSCMLRSGNDLFLDGVTPDELSERINIDIEIVESDGASLAEALLEQ